MENFKKQIELLEYIKKQLSKESIGLLYNANNVRMERVMLFSDFSNSLYSLIFDTYLGDEITSKTDRKKHFEWCWCKTINNFEKEKIFITKTGELKDYIFGFIELTFYQNDDKTNKKDLNQNIIKLWREIFDINAVKTRAEVDTFIEVYNLFTDAIVKK